MSAVGDLAIVQAESIALETGEDFDTVMSSILDGEFCGYICKQCGGPSPLGVGYADNTPGAYLASVPITVCECGYSQLAWVTA